MIKIGLYFGSFNPIHRAHLAVAEHSLQHLDETHFIVSPANPDKEKTGELEEDFHRLNMVQEAVDFIRKYKKLNLYVSDVEFHLPRPSWTDSSIKQFKRDLNITRKLSEKDYQLYIICGRDTHHRIQTWKNKEYIIDKCSFLVYDRSGADPAEDEELNRKSWYIKDLGIIPVSSTLIREKLNKGGEIYDLTLDVVDYYIRKNNLYQK